MAKTYSWADLIAVGSAYGKGIPLSKVNAQICDFVSSDMYTDYPWKDTITSTASGTIPLIDSMQDYPAFAPNILHPLKAWIQRTDTTPDETRDLDIQRDLSVNLYSRSYVSIRAVSLQQAIGKFRLEAAVNVPTGVQLELHVDYQLNPIKVVSTAQSCWFDDRFAIVALEGLLYWVYKLSDDTRAGSVQADQSGRIIGYTGQMGAYKGNLAKMRASEEFGYTDQVFPSEPMGTGRDSNSLNLFGW